MNSKKIQLRKNAKEMIDNKLNDNKPDNKSCNDLKRKISKNFKEAKALKRVKAYSKHSQAKKIKISIRKENDLKNIENNPSNFKDSEPEYNENIPRRNSIQVLIKKCMTNKENLMNQSHDMPELIQKNNNNTDIGTEKYEEFSDHEIKLNDIQTENKSNRRVVLRKNVNSETKISEKEKSHHKISHIPALSTVVGRNIEYKLIENQLLSYFGSDIGVVLYITGVPGSGKTYTTVSLLKYLKLDFVYINCSTLKNKADIYNKISSCFTCINLEKIQISSLRNHFMNCHEKHILVVDEIDFLFTKNEKLLYNLFELPFIDNSNLIIIVISNTLGSLSSKTESRIGKNRIEFKPYTSEQLKSVFLSETTTKSIDQKSLDLIVKRIASSTGDIRKVKDLIENSGNVEISRIGIVLRDAFSPLLTKFIYSFNFYQKLILHVNRDSKISLKCWFENFKTFCVAKSIAPLNYSDFLYVVNDLVNFGIYKIHNDGLNAVSCYLNEEIEQATKNDEDFKKFKSAKTL